MPQTKKTSKLTEREETFCENYVLTGTAREAAVMAGYPAIFSKRKAASMLASEAVRRRITELRELRRSDSLREVAVSGLRRAALGDPGDAIRLLAMSDEEILASAETLDLFCVSEIKRPRGGGLEIRLIDRIKALEALCRLSLDENDGRDDCGFYSALGRAAEDYGIGGSC